MKYIHCIFINFLCLVTSSISFAQFGFVELPSSNTKQSAYVLCNPTGNYGLSPSEEPKAAAHDYCAVSNQELLSSPANAPLDGFRLVGVMVSDVELPKSVSGTRPDVAAVTDAIWRNKDNTECILGTHLQMKDAPMANGNYWEVNDVVRGGFAGKKLSVAYFYKQPHAEVGGSTEVLFRVGRSFTSVKTSDSDNRLPEINNAPPVNTVFSDKNSAAYSDNWVDFTTDVSFKDLDGVTRQHSSILYTKYACNSQDPVPMADAIRLRTTGQNGNDVLEVMLPGLVPIDGSVDKF